MKAFDLLLNAAIVLSATVFLAYLGLLYDFGLFTTLPEGITGFFLDRPVLQYVALAVTIGALIAKVPVRKAIRQQHPVKEG
jgi:hypothetical protein